MSALFFKVSFALLFSFLITFYLVPFFCAIARRLQFVDAPDGKIKLQKEPTPYLGGVAVYSGFLCGLALTMPFDSCVALLIIGTTLLLLLGLVDDLIVLAAYQKFFGQFLVALCFLKAGFYLKEHFFYNIWNMPLSLLWILAIINSFNLVDVMDGLATSIALWASCTFVVIGFLLGQEQVLILLASFIGSLFAFAWYNKPEAQMYLGDAGSLFIGGFLATIPFLFSWGTYNPYGFLAPVIILAIPLLECVTLILVRSYKGIPFYNGSPDHFSCYLLSLGWSKIGILGYVFLLSIYLGIVATLFVMGLLSFSALFATAITFLIVWMALLLYKF